MNSKENKIFGGKLVRPAIPCSACFWPATKKLPTPGVNNATLPAVQTMLHQLQCKYCYTNYSVNIATLTTV